jgi:4-diphosphocytidyl-2-C-methyl-D-erythritol kinase
VVGRRDDGYHLLDSLVVLAGVGDWLELSPARELRLSLSGPRAAGVPADRRNLVWRAAEAFGTERGAAILLEKHLPHAGGIGGGSADAAAALRGLAALWDLPLPGMDELLAIGADVPVCAAGRPMRMRGIGEVLDPLPPLPPLWVVLVNACVEVPTGPVFKALDSTDNTGLPDMPAEGWADAISLTEWLGATRNDLEAPARVIVPAIGAVLSELGAISGCLLARMSGSGGTCFGLFAEAGGAALAAADLRKTHPEWWVRDAELLS